MISRCRFQAVKTGWWWYRLSNWDDSIAGQSSFLTDALWRMIYRQDHVIGTRINVCRNNSSCCLMQLNTVDICDWYLQNWEGQLFNLELNYSEVGVLTKYRIQLNLLFISRLGNKFSHYTWSNHKLTVMVHVISSQRKTVFMKTSLPSKILIQ